jgi:hypothetical protein
MVFNLGQLILWAGFPVGWRCLSVFGGLALFSPPDRFDGWTQGDHLRMVALAFGIDFILNAAYPPCVLDKDSQPTVEVSYAIRTCNEVCKDQTAALTASHPSHCLKSNAAWESKVIW